MKIEKDVLDRLQLTIKKYVEKSGGKMPSNEWLCAQFKLQNHELKIYKRELANRGFLTKRTTHYRVRQTPKQEKEEKPVEKLKTITILVIRVAMAVVGIFCISLSIFFTFNYLAASMPLFWAAVLSVCMIVFSVGSFETMIIFMKKHMYAVTVGITLLWLITISFSMASTLFYFRTEMEAKQAVISTEVSTDQNDSLAYSLAIEEKDKLEKDIDDLKIKISDLQKQINAYETPIDQYNWLREVDKQNKAKLETTLAEKDVAYSLKVAEIKAFLEQGKAVEIDETKEEDLNIYAWLGARLNVDGAQMEFIINAFPAIFVDILAPIAVAIALFLKDDKPIEKRYVKLFHKLFSFIRQRQNKTKT